MALDESHTPKPHPLASDYYQRGVEFATSTATTTQDDDDYDDDDDEATPTSGISTTPISGTSTTPTFERAVTPNCLSQDPGYFSQSVSSSLEYSQPDPPLATTPSNTTVPMDTTVPIATTIPTMTTTLPIATNVPMDTTVPMVTEPVEDSKTVVDSAIPALIPDNMTIEELYAKVMKIFPGFKPHSKLRFSSLLGEGKKSSQPQVWKGAQKPLKIVEGKGAGLKLDIDWVPPPEMVRESDEVRTLCAARRYTAGGHV